jgi:hypothetical protein
MDRFDRDGTDRPPEREDTPAETAERIANKMALALVVAAAIGAVAITSRPSPPRYEAVAAPDGRVVRIDRKTGSMVSCTAVGQCATLLKRGDHIEIKAMLHGREAQPALPAPAPALPAVAAPAKAPQANPAR